MLKRKHTNPLPLGEGKPKRAGRGPLLFITLLGFLIMASLNVMMVMWQPELFTRLKVGAWSAFWNHGEFSGFDTYTYIVISSFRPVYVLTRHPLLAMMMWPLYELNDALKAEFGINCAIYIVAVVWTIIATCSWVLMYIILRKIIELPWVHSLILTLFFFSFSHVMIITFFPDHMSLSLPLILLSIYLAGRAIKKHRPMPLWQSLPLAFIATGVTTTNIVKVGIADFFTQIGKTPFTRVFLHFLLYLIPLALLFGAYSYQMETTQKAEKEHAQSIVIKKAEKDSVFAEKFKVEEAQKAKRRKQQIIDNDIVTNTEYYIDRLPSLVENVFGEGLILHEDHTLKDPNREDHRPVLVRYNHWWYYAIEGVIVCLFLAGLWYGRRERFMWIAFSMFLVDMLLHVGLNFASADVYIMTAHWAFVIPIAIAYLMKRQPAPLRLLSLGLTISLTLFLWWHNLSLITKHILG